ncbi:variable large family protein [Borrelia duttonii]|uniref:Variable large protein n=1 Tax=Borrelia duttonii (strain Ly) TaxID=412419 RepID=B5RP46_BORDL|nr:vlp protein, delta subfamily [Borrelia duttonii Ly]
MKIEKKVEGKIRVIIMMVMMGCNSGGVKDPEKVFLSEMVNLGKGFLDVFVSFGDMITGTLGIKAETKKSEIGGYFSKIAETMKEVREKLEKIVGEYGNYEKVKGKVEEFIGRIGKIEEGAKEAALGASGNDTIGNAVKDQAAKAADITSVSKLVKGIKGIVGMVLGEKEGNADNNVITEEKKDIGKLFGKKDDDRTQEAEAAKANASIGTVSGADILKAMSQSNEDLKADNTNGIEAAKDAAEIAIASAVDNKKEIKDPAKKDAVIAAGIALRAMAKDGKFAAKQDASDKYANAVNGVVANAVSKVLSTLTIAIRNRVDEGLKEINKVLGEIQQGEIFEAKSN